MNNQNKILILIFFLVKWLSHRFSRAALIKKRGVREGLVALQVWLLKKATRTFYIFFYERFY